MKGEKDRSKSSKRGKAPENSLGGSDDGQGPAGNAGGGCQQHYKTDLKKNFGQKPFKQNRQTRKVRLEKACRFFIMAVPDIIKRCRNKQRLKSLKVLLFNCSQTEKMPAAAGWKEII